MRKEAAENPPEQPARGVSLLSLARRDLAQAAQLELFREEAVYARYVKYCKMCNIFPIQSFESWRGSTAKVFFEPHGPSPISRL